MNVKPSGTQSDVAAGELLGNLSIEHVLRNSPLIEIGAEYRGRRSGQWKAVSPKYTIAQKSFNELGEAWTGYDDWRATKTMMPNAER